MERVFVDTSAWIANANQSDPFHASVHEALASWNGRLVTSNLVIAETVTLALYRFGHATALALGNKLYDGSVTYIVRVDPGDERAAWSLFAQRPDKTYSFIDCTSFILMRRLNFQKAIALDEDFAREGFLLLPFP